MDDKGPDSLDIDSEALDNLSVLSSPSPSLLEEVVRRSAIRAKMESDDDELSHVSNPLVWDLTIDKVYNRKSDPLRIASADGILFCIPKLVVLQSVVLLAKISAISPPIFDLTDPVYEKATTIRTLLDILSFKDVCRTYLASDLLYVLLLASKLKLSNAAAFCIQHVKKDFDKGYIIFHALFAFAVAAIVDSEDLAAVSAVSHLKNNGNWAGTAVSGELASQMPVVYALALANFLDNNSPRSTGPIGPKDQELKEKFLQCLKRMKEATGKTIGKRKRD